MSMVRRRDSSSRNRRRRRKGDDGTARSGQDETSDNDDIVDQLRRQRQKQEAAGASSTRQIHGKASFVPTAHAPKGRLGKFDYCERCCSYFPRGEHAHSLERNAEPQPTDKSTPPRCRFPPFHNLFLPSDDAIHTLPHLPPFVDYQLATGTFLGYNSRSRQAYIERWRFQLWARSTRRVTGCVASSPRGEDWYADDSVPSSRSFDILRWKDSEAFPTVVSCRPEAQCTLANRVANRAVEYQDQRAIHTVRRIQNVYQTGEDSLWFGMVVSHELSSETGVKWYRLSSSSNYGEHLPRTTSAGEILNACVHNSARWNDFCSSLDGRRMIIVGESKSGGSCRGPCLAEFVPDQERFTDAQFLPGTLSISLSNMMCVESFDDHSYFFGHANGKLTRWDARTRIEGTDTVDTQMLNVIRLLPQPSQQLLVRGGGAGRRANGKRQDASPLCQLWDVRNLSRAVHNFVLPPNREGPDEMAATFRSNGMATDPGRSLLFSPWVKGGDGYQCPRLGVWGLQSGEYLGSRVLSESDSSRAVASRRRNAQVVVEISDCVTPGWEAPVARTQMSSRSTTCTSISRRSGAVGLWYRIHERCDDKTKSTSVRHLVFDGKCD